MNFYLVESKQHTVIICAKDSNCAEDIYKQIIRLKHYDQFCQLQSNRKKHEFIKYLRNHFRVKRLTKIRTIYS